MTRAHRLRKRFVAAQDELQYAKQAAAALAEARGGAVRSRGDEVTLPALRPLLENATVASILRGYLGGQVRPICSDPQ